MSSSLKRLKASETDFTLKAIDLVQESETEDTSVPGLESLPQDVLECILEATPSLSSLKSWRLVSKSWNEASCRLLQKEAAVPVKVQDESYMNRFMDLLLDRHSFFPSDWPSPFRNYKILETSLSHPAFLSFIRRPNIRITTLEIIHDKDFQAAAFESLLERHRGSIVHLIIRANSDSVAFGTLTSGTLEEGWSSLKSVTLKDSCGESVQRCPHIDFLIKLTRGSNVEEILFDGHLPNIAGIFEDNSDCWGKLTKLALEYEKPPGNVTAEDIYGFMKWTQEIKFPSLNSLAVFSRRDDHHRQTLQAYTPYLLPLIHEFSGVLENLKIAFIPLKLLPSCPKLSYLCCALMDGDRVQDTTEQKFPSLTSVYYWIRWEHVPTYAVLNNGNKKIVSVETCWDAQTSGGALETLWLGLSSFCPNLKTLTVQSSLSSRVLRIIRKRFPELEDLSIVSISSAELLNNAFASEIITKGWPFQAFEDCALLDMPGLTHLRLGEQVLMSKEVIAMLGRLPKIKYLSFHWSLWLHQAQVPRSLGNVEVVKIFYGSKWEKQLLEEISSEMKSLTLKRHG